MYKKIDIFLNGVYICSTNQSKTCKEAIEKIKKAGKIFVASIPSGIAFKIKEGDKIKAFYSKR